MKFNNCIWFMRTLVYLFIFFGLVELKAQDCDIKPTINTTFVPGKTLSGSVEIIIPNDNNEKKYFFFKSLDPYKVLTENYKSNILEGLSKGKYFSIVHFGSGCVKRIDFEI